MQKSDNYRRVVKKKYENQIEQLKVWLDEFVREKYTL